MKKILLVDDNTDISALLENIFKMYNYDIKAMARAAGINNIVKEYQPDLILMDISLPDADGREVCKQLKENDNIPVILFSANSELVSDYKQWRADGYLEKPFELPELLRTVETYL